MITEPRYYDFFYNVYSYYCQNVNDVSDFDFDNIYICSNINEGLAQFNIPPTDNILGATILPINSTDLMRVLVEVTNNYNYEDAKRLIHELTHSYDFIKYAQFYNNGIVDNFRDNHLFRTYEDFSEFHAFGTDELYAFNYFDTISNTNYLEEVMKNQKSLMNNYILQKREQLLSKKFTNYELMQVLGKIFFFDRYNNISDINQSLIYEYLPLLFRTKKYHIPIYKLYEKCYTSIINDSIFENLVEIESLLNQLFQTC